MELYIKKIDVEILDELVKIENRSELPLVSVYHWANWEHDTKEVNEKFYKACHNELVEFAYDTTFFNIHQFVYNSINSIAKRVKPYQRSAQLRIPFYEKVETQRGFCKAGEMVAELVLDVSFV